MQTGRVSFRMFALAALALAAGLSASRSAEDEKTAGTEATPRPRVHDAAIVELSLAVSRAMLEEDLAAAGEAMKRLGAGCRKLDLDDDEQYGSQVRASGMAFHNALNRTRELAGHGDLDEAWAQFSWVQRACPFCHERAREHGVGGLPPVEKP